MLVVGVTTILETVVAVDQLYVTAPLALSVAELPAQIFVPEEDMLSVGVGNAVTHITVAPGQPFNAVAVMV